MPDNPRRLSTRLLAFVLVSLLPAPYLAAQSAPGEIVGHKIKVPGDQVEGTTARLSEVEAEMVAAMAPQQQAERLLQYAISHHVGATDEIKARVKGWLGQIKQTPALDTLVEVATNGNDLRVRAAAWEVQLAALNLAKTTAQVEELLATDRAEPQPGAAPNLEPGAPRESRRRDRANSQRASRVDARTGRQRPAAGG